MNIAIKSITSTKEWQEVENILLDEISNLYNVKNIQYDKGETAISREICADALVKTLRKIKLLSVEEIKIKPEKYI